MNLFPDLEGLVVQGEEDLFEDGGDISGEEFIECSFRDGDHGDVGDVWVVYRVFLVVFVRSIVTCVCFYLLLMEKGSLEIKYFNVWVSIWNGKMQDEEKDMFTYKKENLSMSKMFNYS